MGPLIGGLITEAISWRAAFVFQALVIVVIAILGRGIVDPVPPDPDRPFDIVGAILSAAGLVVVVLGILAADKNLNVISPAGATQPFQVTAENLEVPFSAAAQSVTFAATVTSSGSPVARGTVTSIAPALVSTSRGWWKPLRTTSRRPSSSRTAANAAIQASTPACSAWPRIRRAPTPISDGEPSMPPL